MVSEPARVVVVCMGNICRSPMAQAVLTARIEEAGLSDEIVVDSAGTDAWHIGEDMDDRARAILADSGYHMPHSARQFDPDWFHERDLVLALDSDNYERLAQLHPGGDAAQLRMLRSYDPELTRLAPPDPRLDVPDPYYGGAQGFRQVLTMLEAAADGVIQAAMERGARRAEG